MTLCRGVYAECLGDLDTLSVGEQGDDRHVMNGVTGQESQFALDAGVQGRHLVAGLICQLETVRGRIALPESGQARAQVI